MKDFKDMSPKEQQEWMQAMTIADQVWNSWKTSGRPLSLNQSLLEYEKKRKVIS